MPVDAAFARHDMAILYDSFNTHGADGDFYLSLAQGPCRILDLGCGTGSVALRLADLGHHVTGLDPAPGMLDVARAKDKAGTVRWLAGDARDFALGETFDLIIMTGHVFQVFLDDAETLAVLSSARRHLADGGRLVFESRNPPARAWEGWKEELTRERTDVPGIGPVEVYYQVREAWGDFVRFDAVFTLLESSERRISESTLRFPGRDTIAQLLKSAGFSSVKWLGDWDGTPLHPHSPEIIVIAEA
ncbi:MAG: class I SAM-dependent methyltransferase [Alphaproteobacteria bacterium]|nr:class I SAM-dependent methyltransferase [Rhizobiaceae bacterium]MBU3963060.1 class I SAM-dependent methyltransferase [Alphaproteobacteria bacterium]MBU4048386.1 class I SAM-dependent methyltransferase [Alphaproteobacteria bacterium]MBU4091112.1 class I SAM-dependent methyltransferase [Alphaproteobacteria bacterium]MBU4158543.1 class I SAM-dependent methyltransferase [Alphaproteobacteria bacterium]